MNSDNKPHYYEAQRFRQWWVWALIVGLPLLALAPLLFAPAEPQEALSVLIIVLVIIPLVAGLFWVMRLEVAVEAGGVRLRYFPILSRYIPFNAIAECHARKYNPLLEYGGWGIRWGWKGMAYNVRGNRGVQLALRDGRRLLIGSQRAEELAHAIRQGMAANP